MYNCAMQFSPTNNVEFWVKSWAHCSLFVSKTHGFKSDSVWGWANYGAHAHFDTLENTGFPNGIFRGFTYIPARRGSSLRITTQFHVGTVLWAAQVLLQVMHIFIWHGHFRYVSNVVAVVTIVMHCTMTCLQDGKYCGDSYPPGSLGIRDAGWEKGVYCLLSICFC